MLSLTIDGTTSTVPKENFRTFKDFFNALSEELEKENRVIVSISLNNKQMSNGQQFDYFEKDISDINQVNINTSEKGKLVDDHIEGILEHIEKLRENIEKAAELFRIGDEIESHKYFAAVIEGVRWFNYSLELIFSFLQLKIKEVKLKGVLIADIIEDISEVIDSLDDSQQNQDWIMVADQLEYELLPLIEKWKEILPQLKNIK